MNYVLVMEETAADLHGNLNAPKNPEQSYTCWWKTQIGKRRTKEITGAGWRPRLW